MCLENKNRVFSWLLSTYLFPLLFPYWQQHSSALLPWLSPLAVRGGLDLIIDWVSCQSGASIPRALEWCPDSRIRHPDSYPMHALLQAVPWAARKVPGAETGCPEEAPRSPWGAPKGFQIFQKQNQGILWEKLQTKCTSCENHFCRELFINLNSSL